MVRCVLLFLVGLCTTAMASEPRALPPEPDIAAHQETIRTLYKADYTAKDPVPRIQLAQRLIALSSAGTEAERVALLREATQIAARAGDLDLARAIVDDLGTQWAIDKAGERLAMYQVAVINTPAQARGAGEDLLMACDAAVAVDDYPNAQKLADAANLVARKAKDDALTKNAKAMVDRVRAWGSEYARITDNGLPLVLLSPAQQAELGRFYGLSKGDWPKALPLLAVGDDTELQATARADLAATSAEDFEAVGEQWAASAAKAKGQHRASLYLRALDNLVRASESATGLGKARLDKRIGELEIAAGQPRRATAPAGALFWLDGEAGPDGKSFVDAGPSRLKVELVGQIQFAREAHGGFLRFNGNGNLNIALKQPIPVDGSLSVAFWLRASSAHDMIGICSFSARDSLYWAGRHNAISGAFLLENRQGWYPRMDELTSGSWHHVVFTTDEFTQETRWYLDGRVKVPLGRVGRFAQPIETIGVGTGRAPFVGDLDGFGIWSRILSADEIAALHASGVKGRPAGPAATVDGR